MNLIFDSLLEGQQKKHTKNINILFFVNTLKFLIKILSEFIIHCFKLLFFFSKSNKKLLCLSNFLMFFL